MERKQRWQDWVNVFLGVWLFLAPFFGVGNLSTAASWNSFIFGAAVAVFAAIALARPEKWEEGVNIAIGIWLVIAPFVLGFWELAGATWNHIIVGLIVAGDSLWAIRETPPAREPVSR